METWPERRPGEAAGCWLDGEGIDGGTVLIRQGDGGSGGTSSTETV